jgi:uncharacterized membrane protein YkoI
LAAFGRRSLAVQKQRATVACGKEDLASIFMLRCALGAAALAAGLSRAVAEDQAPRADERASRGVQCFSTTQSREKIEAHNLVDPFACMRAAARDQRGEPLGARLCRYEDAFFYEISVLQPDGRIVRLSYDAATGKRHSGDRDR